MMNVRHTGMTTAPLTPDAESAVLRDWEPLALSIARRMARRFEGTVDREDLEQVARLALLQAARRFDPSRGQFSTFAFPTVAGEIQRYLRDRAPAVSFPRRWFALRSRLRRRAVELAGTAGREPTMSELAERLGMDEGEVARVLSLREFYRPASLDEPREGSEGAESECLADQIGGSDPLLEALELRLALRQAIDALPARLGEVLRLRYFEELSQAEAGRRLGISQMHVSRLEQQALTALRRELLEAAGATASPA
jgi:RNA polymerase sigma-B factor